jgi:hypothetical protein
MIHAKETPLTPQPDTLSAVRRPPSARSMAPSPAASPKPAHKPAATLPSAAVTPSPKISTAAPNINRCWSRDKTEEGLHDYFAQLGFDTPGNVSTVIVRGSSFALPLRNFSP